jgi:hypothetical protein
MMLSSEITYLADITKPKLIDVIPVSALVEQIKKGHPKVTEYRTLLDELNKIDENKDPGDFKKHKTRTDRFKKTLPAYAVAGLFGNSVTDKQFKSSSGLFLVDIDKLENSEEVNNVKQTLAGIPCVAFTFISPGALGLKTAFRICPTFIRNDTSFHTVFKVIKAWLTDEFGIEIDATCKDVRRLCFVSYDPNIYVNEQAERIEFLGLKERYRIAAKLGTSPPPKIRSAELFEHPQATNTGWTPNYVKTAIANELNKLKLTTEGDRNNQLNKSAFKLFALVEKSGHGCLDDLENRLRRSAQAIGLDDSEINATLKSARDAGFKSTRQPPQPKPVDINPEIIERAERLAKFIDKKINGEFKDNLEDQKYAYPQVIAAILASTFWSGQKSKVFMLDGEGNNIIQFCEKDIITHCTRIHGLFCDTEAINTRFSPDGCNKLDAESKKELKAIQAIPHSTLITELKGSNQRDHMTISTDMFIERSMMDIKPDSVSIRFKHLPFETRLTVFEIDPVIINDYKEHFTRLDLFIDFIMQSRFASDRKYAYLWIKADSDWGKGFLMSAISDKNYNKGAITKLSVKEVEKMFEGGPVSKSLPNFKRSIVLHLDEFKTVKSELKQLENEIPVSPKNQLQFEAELFAKVFTSAEGVPALVGDSGIEDQFANRFSYFEEKGMLPERPVFIERGKEAYMKNVQSYICHQLNSRIAQMKAMGPSASADHGNRWLERFIKDHGISNYVERFSKGLPDIAEEFLEWIHTETDILSDFGAVPKNLITDSNKQNFYLKKPKAVWDVYVNTPGNFSFHEKTAISKKYEAIFDLISIDGKHTPKTMLIPGKGRHKVIQLKPKPYSTCGARDHQPWAQYLKEDF